MLLSTTVVSMRILRPCQTLTREAERHAAHIDLRLRRALSDTADQGTGQAIRAARRYQAGLVIALLAAPTLRIRNSLRTSPSSLPALGRQELLAAAFPDSRTGQPIDEPCPRPAPVFRRVPTRASSQPAAAGYKARKRRPVSQAAVGRHPRKTNARAYSTRNDLNAILAPSLVNPMAAPLPRLPLDIHCDRPSRVRQRLALMLSLAHQ